ncbi:MAG TPA: hypothetical protein VEV45_20810 [Streptosporangiaceae bacterium]|nr:hypothetical protein [Streptosporangiaceae bacterium]
MTDQAPDLTADKVASVETNYRWDRRSEPVHPTPAEVAKHLPANFRVGDVQSWRIIVRGKDAEGATLEDVIATLAKAGITAKEVEREGIEAVYQFRTGKDAGSGSFLSPPGNAALSYSIYGYHSSGRGKPRTNRSSGPDTIMSIESLAEDEGGYYPKASVERAKRIIAAAHAEMSELWVRSVYRYFNHSYSPDGIDRNVSNAVFWKPGDEDEYKCSCRKVFDTQQALIGHIAGKRKTLSFDPEFAAKMHHRETPAKPQPPEHHLGYLCVKRYFPNATPRLDLIADPGRGSGPCDKCGEQVQYEARHDAWCVVKVQPWSWNPDCPKGGHHERAMHAPKEGQ